MWSFFLAQGRRCSLWLKLYVPGKVSSMHSRSGSGFWLQQSDIIFIFNILSQSFLSPLDYFFNFFNFFNLPTGDFPAMLEEVAVGFIKKIWIWAEQGQLDDYNDCGSHQWFIKVVLTFLVKPLARVDEKRKVTRKMSKQGGGAGGSGLANEFRAAAAEPLLFSWKLPTSQTMARPRPLIFNHLITNN